MVDFLIVIMAMVLQRGVGWLSIWIGGFIGRLGLAFLYASGILLMGEKGERHGSLGLQSFR